jgi:pimeloyl-ACP methyl ester carboxylesterase
MRGQERPIVFIHGVASGPETWHDAAARLQSTLEIAPAGARVTWRNSLESQGSEVQSQVGGLPPSTIAVGHSLGGLVARQWSRQRPLDGVITVGSPNRGAPIANHINEWAGFNAALFNAVATAFTSLGGLSYDRWWWVYSAVEGALGWGGFVADFSLRHLFVDIGMQFGFPFVQQVYVGSPYLDDLNGGNLGREAAAIPARVGIVNTASRYWEGGPFRLKDPNYGGELSILTSAAAAALDYWGFSILADADPLDWPAHEFAYSLLNTSFWLWNFDEFWCRAISDNRPIWSGHCLPNDGFVPTWSQFYPGASMNLEVIGGPMHTEETAQFGDILFMALTTFMHVPVRGSAPPTDVPPGPDPLPPHLPPPGGTPSVDAGRSLYPGEYIHSPDRRFHLVYQHDGNLVLYTSDGVPVWHSATHGTTPGRMVMQLDGNLVVEDASGTPRWASGSVGYDRAYLSVQDTGMLVVYTAGGVPVWTSGMSGQ